MSGTTTAIRCARCGREGTRDFETVKTQSGVVTVCANKAACEKRRIKEHRPRQPPRSATYVPRRVEQPWGTLFFASKVTRCPYCSCDIHKYELVVNTSWTDVEEGSLTKGHAEAVHLDCAKRSKLRVEYTKMRIHRDLHKILSGVENRSWRGR